MMETFKDHILTTIEEWNADSMRGEYIFKRPNTSMYFMHIIFRRGTIIVYGDVQPNVIFRQPDIDLPWLNGSVDTPSYLFSKAVAGVDRKYDKDATIKWCKELMEGLPIEQINADMAQVDWDNESEAYQFFIDNFNEEYPCGTFKHCDVLLNGLQCFVKAIQNQEQNKMCKQQWVDSNAVAHQMMTQVDGKRVVDVNHICKLQISANREVIRLPYSVFSHKDCNKLLELINGMGYLSVKEYPKEATHEP